MVSEDNRIYFVEKKGSFKHSFGNSKKQQLAIICLYLTAIFFVMKSVVFLLFF